jgi:hypothetical protein
MKRINHEARPGGPTMAAVSATRLSPHAPVIRLELLQPFADAPGSSPVGGELTLHGWMDDVLAPISGRSLDRDGTAGVDRSQLFEGRHLAAMLPL